MNANRFPDLFNNDIQRSLEIEPPIAPANRCAQIEFIDSSNTCFRRLYFSTNSQPGNGSSHLTYIVLNNSIACVIRYGSDRTFVDQTYARLRPAENHLYTAFCLSIGLYSGNAGSVETQVIPNGSPLLLWNRFQLLSIRYYRNRGNNDHPYLTQ
jgi:hypothetical protein